MALYVDISLGDSLVIGDVTVALQFKTGKKARLKIEAPKEIELKLTKDETASQK